MTEKTKTKLLVIVSALLFISIVYIVYWIGFERKALEGNIFELNRGAELDYKYINSQADFAKKYYDIWQTCNKTLSSDLKGELSENELELFMLNYAKQAEELQVSQDEILKLKEEIQAEKDAFKHAILVKQD